MPQPEHPVRQAFANAVRTGAIAQALEGARKIYVGYSGGADSTALLTLTAEYCRIQGISVQAVHVHHGIRGAEADRDASFCRSFCAERGIPLAVCRVDAPAYAASRQIGLEEAARQLRYAEFDALTKAEPDSLCATAHSASDNLETVLFHMLRGTGLDGVCGIPPARNRIIRPLLFASAEDIRDFCCAEGLSYVEDSTNTDTSYTRNYIRAVVVPALRRVAPSPEEAVSRMCALLREDAAYLNHAAEQALGEYGGGSSAPLELLARLPETLCSRACAILYQNASGTRADLAAVHIRSVCALVRRGEAARVCLPGEICARVFNGTLSFLPRAVCEAAPPADFSCELEYGEKLFPEFGFGVCISPENGPNFPAGENIYKLSICKSFPSATIQGRVILRFRRPGDTIRAGGMTRSVKKLLSAARLPPEKRAFLPLFCDDAGVFWIPGVSARDFEDAGAARVYFSCFAL